MLGLKAGDIITVRTAGVLKPGIVLSSTQTYVQVRHAGELPIRYSRDRLLSLPALMKRIW